MDVRIVNHSKHPLPSYQTIESAGMDLRANTDEDITLNPMERKLIGTGLHIELPVGFEAQIRPRSGLAYKFGITVLNSPGTVDSDYRGELKVLLVNLSEQTVTLKDGERIAQLVVARHEKITWMEADSLTDTERGQGGYGSTGR
ncbi:Deoxyuridine 5'-triphosphate nucleotidohydrolase [Lunatimonas lonarensis]|uniref:Deoxyuridine 5'-triphosphate nucleotidohydrolase n=1 Tax=Lunatimonas lonarensis TaxID=1232681 RepID=R7ZX61_9BACT|nr:dUTP diphosphatase [Lunatimonas lonarensis]EON78583.1 Deoxyuridine 5'-triphosphate nucleotidohydrolase [Lunatimonas lonarensis]